MNEEIKEILGTINNDIENYYVGTNGCLYQDLTKEQLLLIKNYITNLQQRVEQLEKENKKLIVNCNIGNDNLTFYKKQWQRLENIRKEAIDKLYCWGEALYPEFQKSMLNILNKGSE